MTVKKQTEVNLASLFNYRLWSARRIFGTTRPESGQSVLEVALLSPLLVLMLFGMIDLSRWVFQAVEVSSAARAGAQYGAQNLATAADTGSTGGIVTAAKNDVPDIPSLIVTPSTVCQCATSPGTNTSCTSSCAGSGGLLVFVKVDTSATFQTWIPYPRLGLASSVTMKGHAVFAVGQ
jgi:Flp pilus assembly protein TadG